MRTSYRRLKNWVRKPDAILGMWPPRGLAGAEEPETVNLTKKRQKNKTQHNIAVVSTGEESSKRALLEP